MTNKAQIKSFLVISMMKNKNRNQMSLSPINSKHKKHKLKAANKKWTEYTT